MVGLLWAGQVMFGSDMLGIREYSERCADYYARMYSLSPALVRAIIQHESAWQPRAVSSKGTSRLSTIAAERTQ